MSGYVVVRGYASRRLWLDARAYGRVAVGEWVGSRTHAFVFRSKLLAESFAERWSSMFRDARVEPVR